MVLELNQLIIERCFGIVKRQFKKLGYIIRTTLDHAPTIILSCFILHHVVKYLDEDFDDSNDVDKHSNP